LQLALAKALQLDHVPAMDETNDHVIRLEEAVRAAGVRVTRQRAAILKILTEAHDHPDANELHRRAHTIDPSVSLSTVYRTLSVLEKQGVVHRHTFEGVPARFETTEMPHHDHLIDLDTGTVLEFRSDKIERLQAEIAEELGYDLIRHRLELYCRKRAKAAKP
jgi:Fur family ferric uptake transcriptional regulator